MFFFRVPNLDRVLEGFWMGFRVEMDGHNVLVAVSCILPNQIHPTCIVWW